MAQTTLVEVLLWLDDLFLRHGVDRSYGGALARNFYAPPRFTKDIDVLARVSALRVPGLVEDLAAANVERLRTDPGTGREELEPLDLRGFLLRPRSD